MNQGSHLLQRLIPKRLSRQIVSPWLKPVLLISSRELIHSSDNYRVCSDWHLNTLVNDGEVAAATNYNNLAIVIEF